MIHHVHGVFILNNKKIQHCFVLKGLDHMIKSPGSSNSDRKHFNAQTRQLPNISAGEVPRASAMFALNFAKCDQNKSSTSLIFALLFLLANEAFTLQTRSIDGSGNYRIDPNRGAVGAKFGRQMGHLVSYEDGVSSPMIGPNARHVVRQASRPL